MRPSDMAGLAPVAVVNTRPRKGRGRSPRSASWRSCCTRRASTAWGISVMVRRDFAVFGASVAHLPSTRRSLRRTVRVVCR